MIFAIKHGEFGEDVIGVNSYNDFCSAYEMLKHEGHENIQVYKISSKLEKSEIDEILSSFPSLKS